jgi:DNA ligase (NAD+)
MSSNIKNRITKSLIAKLEANPRVESLTLDISFLEKIIAQAINDYYNTDKPLLTDNTFDILENILREKKPNSKVFDKIGASVVNSADAVKLPYYLGSLDKVKPNEKSLTKWISKHNKQIVISEKLDGLSSLLVISLGKLDNLLEMQLYKHGDGYEGQDISHLLDNILIGNLNKKLITEMIEHPNNKSKHIALRGEIIIKNSIYNTKYNKMYPKARSLIAGIVNSKTPEKTIIKDMEIIFYELIYPSEMTFLTQFETISKLGFNIAKYKIYKTLIESQLPNILIEFKKESEYEIDGIVLDDSSQIWTRAKKDNPEYAVAFKMQLEDQIATTTVINVEYNISKHGTLAPRIEYKPIVIKGDTHQYTTGFNLKYIVDNKINKGTELKIIKSGDVIPYIYEIIKHSEEPQMPSNNIKWHWNETHVDGIIDDIENNQDVRTQKIIAFFKIMKIDGIGEGIVNKFINAGYDEINTILDLTPEIISKINGFQLKSAVNVFNAIHKVIDKHQPLERVMMASGVFGLGLGEKKFKVIIDAIPELIKKWQSGKITKSDILAIDGFSNKTSELFILGMPKFIDWLKLYSIIKIETNDIAKADIPKETIFSGMVAVFTGIRNPELEKKIINGGGNISSSLSGKTTIVIAKDINENSSKLNKAREMGIEIINIIEFEKKYLA